VQKSNDSLSARRAYIGSLRLGPLKAAVAVANATLGGLTETSRNAATA